MHAVSFGGWQGCAVQERFESAQVEIGPCSCKARDIHEGDTEVSSKPSHHAWLRPPPAPLADVRPLPRAMRRLEFSGFGEQGMRVRHWLGVIDTARSRRRGGHKHDAFRRKPCRLAACSGDAVQAGVELSHKVGRPARQRGDPWGAVRLIKVVPG